MRTGILVLIPALAALLDWAIGDPPGRWHPVIGIGRLISSGERLLRGHFPETPSGRRQAGILLVLLVLAGTLLPAGLLTAAAYRLHWAAGSMLEIFLCGWLLAARSLRDESRAVAEALGRSLTEGREAVSRIVGRDTERLTEEGVIRAAVETVAENTSDGIVAPLLYMACFGAAGGFFYKAVNTMDSMVGYRNERYRDFGRAAARLDDALNLLPARLTGLLMILSAAFCGEDAAGARRIFFRDRLKHDSPNSAHPEAAMAGALGVQLAGDAWYFGERHRKPVIGDDTRPVETGDIARAHRLMIGSECLAVLLFTGLRAVWLAWLFRLRLPL